MKMIKQGNGIEQHRQGWELQLRLSHQGKLYCRVAFGLRHQRFGGAKLCKDLRDSDHTVVETG